MKRIENEAMNLQEAELSSKSLTNFEKRLQPLTCPQAKEGNSEVPTQKSKAQRSKSKSVKEQEHVFEIEHEGARTRAQRSKNKSTEEQKSRGA